MRLTKILSATKKKGCKIITMSGFKENNSLWSRGEINFYVPSSFYEYVELVHAILCHCIVDILVYQNKPLEIAIIKRPELSYA